VISECVIVIGKDWLVAANDEVHLHGAPGYRAKTPSAQRKTVVISTQREKSFLDPSSLGVTGLGPSPWRPLLLLRESQSFDSLDPKFGPKISNTFG